VSSAIRVITAPVVASRAKRRRKGQNLAVPGTRGWERELAVWVGLWGWVGALIVAIGLFVVGLVVSDVGHATVRGRPMLNGRAAIAETARDAHARGTTSLDGGTISCYFAEVGPTYSRHTSAADPRISVAPSTGDGTISASA